MHIDGRAYHLTTYGTATDTTPLILLHGFTGSGADWGGTFGQRHDVLAYAPDLPGHGQTRVPDEAAAYAMPQIAADIVTMIERLNAKPAHLLGYSMGGRLALYIAAHYPDFFATLTLVSASPGLRTDAERAARRESDEALAAFIQREGIEAFVNRWEKLSLWDSQQRTLTDAARDALRQRRLMNAPDGLARSLRHMGTGAQPSLWDALPDMTLPVHLIVGEHDAKFRAIASDMASALPHVQTTVIDNAGHALHLEQPQAFVLAVQDFVSRHSPG